MALERTLFIVKPDAVQRRLIGRILAHVEERGFRIVEARFMRLTREQCQEFYSEHQGKAFFNDLVEYMTGSPYIDAIVATPWQLDADGMLPIPAAPGLGVTLDPAAVEKYTGDAGFMAG